MKIKVGLIDYGAGNLYSVENALSGLKCDVVIASKPEMLEGVDKVILPGVGAFPDGIKNLNNLGFSDYIKEYVSTGGSLLGICLGMQLLLAIGNEGERTNGLGLVDGSVEPIIASKNCRVPHMGWNDIEGEQEKILLFDGIDTRAAFYFVHSFHAVLSEDVHAVYTSYCDKKFVAAYQKDNLYGVQFHPEKSQKVGIKLLDNFIWHGS